MSQQSFFRDTEFPVMNAVNGLFHSVQEHHASELAACLFHHSATVTDIEQEFVGNCWFLASVCSLLEQCPGFIESIMDIDSQWKVTVKFADEEIVIDAYLPCVIYRGQLTPLSSNPHAEVWVPLLNKAMCKYLWKHPGASSGIAHAKCHKKRFSLTTPHFELIQGGLPGWVWQSILGVPTTCLPSKPQFYDEIFNICSDSKYIVNVCSGGRNDKNQRDKIVQGHCYSILGTAVHSGERIIKLRNPWGKTEPDNRFTRILSPQDDGVFYLTFKELTKYFPRVYYCQHNIQPP